MSAMWDRKSRSRFHTVVLAPISISVDANVCVTAAQLIILHQLKSRKICLGMAENTAEELERFRQQWQEEVVARSKGAASSSKSARPARPARPPHRSSGATQTERAAAPIFHKPYREPEEGEESGEDDYHDLEDKDEARKLGEAGEGIHPSSRGEPSSALEHYERAVERESVGSLGDSLNHYRKAFRVRCRPFIPRQTILIHGSSSMQASTVFTRINTSHPPHSNRNLPIQIRPTQLSRCPTQPTIPWTGPPHRLYHSS